MPRVELSFLYNLPLILCDVLRAVYLPNYIAGHDSVTGLYFSPCAAICLPGSSLTPVLNGHV